MQFPSRTLSTSYSRGWHDPSPGPCCRAAAAMTLRSPLSRTISTVRPNCFRKRAGKIPTVRACGRRASTAKKSPLDSEKQIEIYHRMHRIIYDDQPYTFLFSEKWTALRDARLKNIKFYKIRPAFDAREWTATKPRELEK